MPETVDGKKIFTLQEVATSIQKTLSVRYTSSFWVKAEMNKLNHYPHSGHAYPELVDKVDGKVIAQLKSVLWRDDYLRINRNFLKVLESPLKDGIRMLFCANVTFDPVYGLALRITDIDPVFSLGELEREKQESIARLKEEGIFDQNRSLLFPMLPQRLAIISVETSKGYADFNNVIDNNPWGYRFFHHLFPSVLQGDRAVDAIRYQLSRIRLVASHFDTVAIIRGGGGEVGLSSFNDFNLSRDIARFPIPVLTGIGHATNETVAEMVSYRNAITPTELADFLLQHFHNFAGPVNDAEAIIVQRSSSMIADERQLFHHAVRYFRSVTANVLIGGRHQVQDFARSLLRESGTNLRRERQLQDLLAQKLKGSTLSLCRNEERGVRHNAFSFRKAVQVCLKQEQARVSNVARTVANLHPDNVLRRGYSITRIRGKALVSIAQAGESEEIETVVADGVIVSKIKSVSKPPVV